MNIPSLKIDQLKSSYVIRKYRIISIRRVTIIRGIMRYSINSIRRETKVRGLKYNQIFLQLSDPIEKGSGMYILNENDVDQHLSGNVDISLVKFIHKQSNLKRYRIKICQCIYIKGFTLYQMQEYEKAISIQAYKKTKYRAFVKITVLKYLIRLVLALEEYSLKGFVLHTIVEKLNKIIMLLNQLLDTKEIALQNLSLQFKSYYQLEEAEKMIEIAKQLDEWNVRQEYINQKNINQFLQSINLFSLIYFHYMIISIFYHLFMNKQYLRDK
ncbi:hypothetical protein pb186bvf_015061 [Paramecium bursaria]